MAVNIRTRALATTLAGLAALTLTLAAPVTAEAKIKVGVVELAKIRDFVGPAEALVAPGLPPTPCAPGRWKCPLGTGAV
ncbi:hypothetical protein [Leifsonia sp. SIMBA_070]|uniref:hypothetical protein n=1 Tax=Leifsonia sp. SIMBA_070 TaxID=3085810 RepID=UPI00397AE3EA